MVTGSSVTAKRDSIQATTLPTTAPMQARRVLSANHSRTIRNRSAPRAMRTRVTFHRSQLLASNRTATLAHATRRRSVTAPKNRLSVEARPARFRGPKRWFPSTRNPTSSFHSGYISSSDNAIPPTSARTASILEPGAIRPITVSQNQVLLGTRFRVHSPSRGASRGCTATGTHIWGGSSTGLEPTKPAGAMPTTSNG